eukprot:4521254-Amphidinium_carterae.1
MHLGQMQGAFTSADFFLRPGARASISCSQPLRSSYGQASQMQSNRKSPSLQCPNASARWDREEVRQLPMPGAMGASARALLFWPPV